MYTHTPRPFKAVLNQLARVQIIEIFHREKKQEKKGNFTHSERGRWLLLCRPSSLQISALPMDPKEPRPSSCPWAAGSGWFAVGQPLSSFQALTTPRVPAVQVSNAGTGLPAPIWRKHWLEKHSSAAASSHDGLALTNKIVSRLAAFPAGSGCSFTPLQEYWCTG